MKKAIFKLKLRKDRKNIDGTYSVCIYFRERGKTPRLISTHLKCHPTDWSQKEQAYKQSSENSYILNNQINAVKKTCNTIVENCYIENKHLTLVKFKQELNFNDQPTNNVFDYITTVISRKKGTIKPESLKSYTQLKNKLELMYPAKDLYFTDINHNFLTRFEKYLLEHNNNKNTVCRKHKTLQVVINHALKDDLIKKDPYQFFPKNSIVGERKPITETELKTLIELYKKETLSEPYQKALKMFLFMCLTGLRISDLLNLKYKNIITDTDKDGNAIKLLDVSQIKTQSQTTIPILFNLLDKFIDPDGKGDEFICREFQNGQNINFRLRTIRKKAEITKKLTNHVARHSFATLAINNGVDIYTVSRILGHKSIKTTEIYVKLSNRHKIEEMQKIKNLFG
jgi:integrase